MAYVTAIGANPEQIDYRLGGSHGCENREQMEYHLAAQERPLRWVGSGLEAVGLVVGAELGEVDHDRARALMNGVHPVTGERLIEHKVAVFRDAKVAGVDLVRAVHQVCADRGESAAEVLGSSRLAAMFERVERAVLTSGEAALVRADHAGQLVDAAGLDPAGVWGEGEFDRAVVGFRSLTEGIDTTTAQGRLVLGLFGSLAEFERELIRERTLAGLAAAAARGRRGGRPTVMTPAKLAAARSLLREDGQTVTSVAQTLGVSRSTLHRHLVDR